MELVTIAQQYAFDGTIKRTLRHKFAPGEYASLRERAEAFRKTCDTCGKDFFVPNKRDWYYWSSYYSDPWNDGEPDTHEIYCSEDCERSAMDSDFAPEYCDYCERSIIQRNPRNGWRGYFFFVDDDSSIMICVRCYQEDLLDNGQSVERTLKGTIPADFFNESDLTAAGYAATEKTFFVPRENESYRAFCLYLLNQGKTVLTNLESSGMGMEGYVSVWAKE